MSGPMEANRQVFTHDAFAVCSQNAPRETGDQFNFNARLEDYINHPLPLENVRLEDYINSSLPLRTRPAPIGVNSIMDQSNATYRRTNESASIETVQRNHFNVSLEGCNNRPLPLGVGLRPISTDMKSSMDKLKATHKKIEKSAPIIKKIQPAHFGATLLKIGTFKFVPTETTDLEARCLYARQKLIWEIKLDTDKFIKHRIEISWHNIIAMKATIEENKRVILEIELTEAPIFYREIYKPKCRSSWEQSKDFTTQGQASIYRRHYLEFSTEDLDKYYAMLQSDKRLLELSQLPYPRMRSPYFPSNPLLHQGTIDSSHVGVLCGATPPSNSISNNQLPHLISPQQIVPDQYDNTMPSPSIYSTSSTLDGKSLLYGQDDININEYKTEGNEAEEMLCCEGDNQNFSDIMNQNDHNWELEREYMAAINSYTYDPAYDHSPQAAISSMEAFIHGSERHCSATNRPT